MHADMIGKTQNETIHMLVYLVVDARCYGYVELRGVDMSVGVDIATRE